MLRILQIEQIEQKLREVPGIIDGYKRGDSNFPEQVEEWLKELEVIISNNRLSTSGTLAGLRAVLISVKEGARPQGINIVGRPTQKKLRRAVAADVINKAVNVVEATIQNDKARMQQGEQVALNLIAYAKHLGMIKSKVDPTNGSDFAKFLFTSMKSEKSTAEGVLTLEALLGVMDSLISINRCLSYGEV